MGNPDAAMRDTAFEMATSNIRYGQGVTAEIHTKPLVWWLWFGGGLMALGCIISLLPSGRGGSQESQQGQVG